jgi:hypothetical protein
MGEYLDFKQETDFAVEKIRTGAMTMAQGAIELGYQLKVARDTGVLQESGYKTMTEFAGAEYGIRADETTRYIQLNDKYSEGGYSKKIMEKYTGIGKSILVEMLALPDLVKEEITPNFSKEDVRTLAREVKEENEITDLEVMIEEKDSVQEKLSSLLEKTVYQLGKDNPDIYTALFEALQKEESQEVEEILTPDEEKIYSVRIPGTGRILASMKKTENIRLINVRSQEKEEFTWQQFKEALEKSMDFSVGAQESWKMQYKEEFPKSEEAAEETNTRKKPPKVATEKKTEKKNVEKPVDNSGKSQKTAVPEEKKPERENAKADPVYEIPDLQSENQEKNQKNAQQEDGEQIPGQDSILNHEEYMPKPEQTAAVPENASEKSREPQPSEESTPSAGIAPAQPHEVVDKPISRKEYLDSLTEYGAADHIAKAFESFGNVTFSQFKSTGFWERWLNMKVDHLGRNWVD